MVTSYVVVTAVTAGLPISCTGPRPVVAVGRGGVEGDAVHVLLGHGELRHALRVGDDVHGQQLGACERLPPQS